MTALLFDIEADGLLEEASVMHCIGVMDLDTEEYQAYGPDEIVEGLMRLQDADLIAGHFIRGYDVPLIEKLTDGLITIDQSRIVDTCELSRDLAPFLRNHRLETWGQMFGFPKLPSPDFSRFSPEMLVYLERDVRLNKLVWDWQMERLYGLEAA